MYHSVVPGVISRNTASLGAFLPFIPDTIRDRLSHLAHTQLYSIQTLLLGTIIAAPLTYLYLRRMAPDRSAGTDIAPKEKRIKVFPSLQSESYG